MGLSYDEYKKMKDEGRIRWDTDAINKARTDIGQFLSGVDSQMKALGTQWTPEEFSSNQSRIAEFKDSLQYMQGYMNSIKNSNPEGYEELRAQHNELSKLIGGAENWFSKNSDEEKRNYWYETAQNQRKQAADAVNTVQAVEEYESTLRDSNMPQNGLTGRNINNPFAASQIAEGIAEKHGITPDRLLKAHNETATAKHAEQIVSEMKQGRTTAAQAAAEYGLGEKQLQANYDELRAYEKQQDRESKYGGLQYDELVGLLKSPDSIGQKVYDEIRDEYGAYLKDYSDYDKSRIFESRGEKYGLSGEQVREIYDRISQNDDKHYASTALSDEDKAYIAKKIIETGTGDQLSTLKKTLPVAKYYDTLRNQLEHANQIIEEKQEDEYYLSVIEKYPNAANSVKYVDGQDFRFKEQVSEEEKALYLKTYAQMKKDGVDTEKFEKFRKRYEEHQQNLQDNQALRDFTGANWLTAALMSVDSTPVNMVGSILDLPKIAAARVEQLFGGDGYYDPAGTWNYKANIMRDEAGKVLAGDNRIAQFLYSTGTSMQDMVLAAAVNQIPVAGQFISGAMFFSSAGVNAANEVIENGGDLGQATKTMIAQGAAELIFENVSLEKLKVMQAKGNVKGIKDLFANVLKQSFTEGSEEVATTLANTLTDGVINGDNSSINRAINQYMQNGYSREEAEKQAWKDWGRGLFDDFLGGALSGGVLGGGVSTVNLVKGKSRLKLGGVEITKAEAADLIGESNSEAAKTAQKIVKDNGVDAVLDAAKKSVDAQTRKTAEHFAELHKEGKLDEKDAAQLFVKVANEQVTVDAIAQMTGAETLSDYQERQAQSGKDFAAFDYAGNKLETGQREIKSSFGEAHKNGLTATDRNGKAVVVLGIESSAAEYGRNDNTVSVKLSDGSIVDAAGIALSDEAYAQLLNLAPSYDTLGARALLANYESAKASGMSLDDYKGAFNALYEMGGRGVSFESAAKNPQLLSVIRGMGETAARGAIEAGMNDRDISVRTQSYLLKKVRVPRATSAAESRVYAERGVSVDDKSELMNLLQVVAEKTGKEIVLTDMFGDDENGQFANDRIYVNAKKPDHVIFTTALHEATHNARVYDPEGFRALEKFVVNYLTEQGKDIDKMLTDISAIWGKDAPTSEVQMEELVCKTVESLAMDENALQIALETKKNQSILKKVSDALKRIADRVMKFFKGDGELAAHNAQAQAFIDDHQALERMAALCSTMFDEARENERKFGGRESEERFAKIRPFYRALDSSEWSRFYKAAMKNNQSDAFRIGDNAIVLPYENDYKGEYGSFGCKVVIYDTVDSDVPVYAVYKIINYNYNIHDDTENTANVLVRLVEDGYDEIDIKAALQNYADLYGQVFQKYSKASGKYYQLTRRRIQNGKIGGGTSFGTGFFEQTQGEVSGDENIEIDPNARYSKDDTIYDSLGIEDLFDDYEDSGMLDEVDPRDPYGRTTGQIIDDEIDLSRGKSFDVGKYMNEHTPTETVMVIYDAMARTAERGIKGFDSVKLSSEDYLRIARRVMRSYGIKERLNRELAGEIAGDIEQFVKDVKDFKKGDFSTFINALVTKCRKYLEHSGDYQYDGAYEEAAKQIKSYLRGGTLMITPYAQSEVLYRYDGDVKKLRQALKGYVHVGFERDKEKYQRPIYMNDLLDFVSDLTTHGETLGDFSFLFPNGERPDSLEAWGWLADLLKNQLQPTFVNPYYDGYHESIDSAALEMAFELVTDIVQEKGERAKAGRNADQKQLREIRNESQKALAERTALHKAKAEGLNRQLERARSRYLREHGLRELAEEDLATLKAFVRSDTKNFREQYLENAQARKDLESVRRNMAKLRTMIVNPTNEKFIPPEILHNEAFLNAVEALGEGIVLNKRSIVAEKMGAMAEQIRQLRNESEKYDGDFQEAFDEGFADRLHDIANNLTMDYQKTGAKGTKKISRETFDNFEISDLRMLVDEIVHRIENARKLLLRKDGVTAREASDAVIRETRAIKDGKAKKKFSEFAELMMNPLRAVNQMADFNEKSELRKLFYALNEGQRKEWLWEMNAEKMFTELVERNDKEYKQACNDVIFFDYTHEGKGYHIEMTRMQALQVLMTWKRESRSKKMNHMKRGGIRVADPKAVSKGKGDLWENTRTVPVGEDLISQIIKAMGDFENSYMLIAERYFNEVAKKAINETFMVTRHREIAVSDYYIPVRVDNDFKKGELSTLKFDYTIEGAGSYKHITPHAPQPILIESLNSVIERHIKQTGKLYGLDIPLVNFKRMWKGTTGFSSEGNEWYAADSVKKALSEKFGKNSVAMIEKAVTELESTKDTDTDKFSKIADFLYKTRVKTSLVGNLGVVIKQAASYPTAGLYLSGGDLTAGLAKFAGRSFTKHYNDIIKEIDAHTAQHYIRRKGMSVQEVSDMFNKSKLARKAPAVINPVKWIQGMDCLTTAALWEATKSNINREYKKAHKEIGSEEYWQDVTKLYDTVIEDTQPMYDSLHRSQFQKNSNSMRKALFPFKTQPMQNMGILANAAAEFVTKRDKTSAKKFAKAVSSQVVSNFVFSLMTFAAAWSRHRDDHYKDDENDALTFGSITGGVLWDMLTNGVNTAAPVGGDYLQALIEDAKTSIEKLIGGEENWLNTSKISEATSLSIVNDWFDRLRKSANLLNQQINSVEKANVNPWDFFWKIADVPGSFAEWFGIPYSNLSTIAKGIGNRVKDGYMYGLVNNKGELKTDHITQHILTAYDSGNKKKGDELTRMWIEQKMSEGKSREQAQNAVDDKLIEGAAQREEVMQAAIAEANGNYPEAAQIKQELVDMGLSEYVAGKAVDKVIPEIKKQMKAENITDFEEAEGELTALGFNENAAEKLAADYIKSLDTTKSEPAEYTETDAFNALKNGELESYELVKAYLVENGSKSGEEVDKDMRSLNKTKPLFKELEDATDNGPRERLDRINQTLLNIYGDKAAVSEAYERYKKNKNK